MQFPRALRAAAALFALSFLSFTASAQDWPAKPVKIVVPFAAGGTTDVVGRLVAIKLGEKWKNGVVIENKLGAGGNIGADNVAKSAPDGYTLLLHSGSIAINPNIYRKMPYAQDDLVPITNIAGGPLLVMVRDNSPYKTLKDLVGAAKASPGKLNFGSAGIGSQIHMAGENFAYVAGVDVTHVPYKGEAVALNDLVAGQIDFVMSNFPAGSALIGPGRLRALAVTDKVRSPLLPDVPTSAEAGLPKLEINGWFGLFAPAGTPRDVLDKIHRDVTAVLQDTEIKARLYVQGMKPIGNRAPEFAKAVKSETAQWGTIVKTRGIPMN